MALLFKFILDDTYIARYRRNKFVKIKIRKYLTFPRKKGSTEREIVIVVSCEVGLCFFLSLTT